MTLQPLRDIIVIRPDHQEKTLEAGVLIIRGATAKAEVGTIVAIGPGTTDAKGRHIEPTLKVGDRVAFQTASIMHEHKENDEVFYLMVENQITGVVDA